MTNVGILGIGFMGMIHYQAIKRLAGVRVSALSTRNPQKLAGDWTTIQGNFGPPGAHEDLADVRTYADAAAMLADPAVDLVDICLNNSQHAEWVIRALEAGKHVLCEKAIALTVEDADRMLGAAAKSGRRLLIAHVLPFFADFRFALAAIRGGEYGRLRAAHFRRHISPPQWSDAMKDADWTGGPVIDLHIHDTHFVLLACGKPGAVFSQGSGTGEQLDYISTEYLYDDGPIVSATSGAINQNSRMFTHGYEIYLEKATIHYEAGGPVTVYGPDGFQRPELPATDPVDSFAEEIQEAVAAVQGHRESEILDPRLARDALALCHKEMESARTRTVLDV